MLIDTRKDCRVHHLTGKRLRRARHLFIWLHRDYILRGGDLEMNQITRAMHRHGLYAKATAERDTRFFILRRLFKVYNFDNSLNWSQWYSHYKWQTFTWKKQA